MNLFWIILIVLSLVLTIYLIFIFYKKYSQLHPQNADAQDALNPDSFNFIKKIKLIRYNPFDDLGGDQSFILCLLDKSNSGVIITSLHTKDLTRIYAKPIKAGQGDGVALSQEESKALEEAVKN